MASRVGHRGWQPGPGGRQGTALGDAVSSKEKIVLGNGAGKLEGRVWEAESLGHRGDGKKWVD